ncbi:hypothetical protein BRADI_1g09774v3 [Brachypodium distachyon]|uniref:Uncharacterized protein n=1 Tax=Brachypodium distachyon TaxID=15368 RepID=A0A2K2DIT3_BRADI|nr:hypothetical protein BRADI_1g09774v3 [Brachypodium distachyon]
MQASKDAELTNHYGVHLCRSWHRHALQIILGVLEERLKFQILLDHVLCPHLEYLWYLILLMDKKMKI